MTIRQSDVVVPDFEVENGMESRCVYRDRWSDVFDEVRHGDKLDTRVVWAAGGLAREDGSTCILIIRTLEYSILLTISTTK